MGSLGHLQFEYELCPEVFGARPGWGPLVLAPDTNVLIDLVAEFDRVESTFGFRGEHVRLLSEAAGDRIDALRALFVLWFWRDLRFYVPAGYVTDSHSKKLAPDRVAERERVVTSLEEDLFARGGLERSGHNDAYDETPEAWCEADREARHLADRAAGRITGLIQGNDGVLTADAAAAGCHVFLTEDTGVLKRAARLRSIAGIAAMSPAGLLEALAKSGEFDEPRMSNGGLVPDLQSLAHFYGLIDSDDRAN
jgi:hypothetical protein